jgi:hypothetical protein
MDGFEALTCVKFVPRVDEEFYIHIYSGRGCSSHVGKSKDPGQKLSLKNQGCTKVGTIQHELIHALGFTHMHNHEARDMFVTIQWDNIKPDHAHNFRKVNPELFGNFGTPYDYGSIMHYRPKSFSINGEWTIVPNDPSMAEVMGQRIGLSDGDVIRINKMYDCEVEYDSISNNHDQNEIRETYDEAFGEPAFSGIP